MRLGLGGSWASGVAFAALCFAPGLLEECAASQGLLRRRFDPNDPVLGPPSRDFSTYNGLDMFAPTVHQVSFSSVYQPHLKHANVYCEMCATIAGSYFEAKKDACTYVPRVNRRACERLLRHLVDNPFFQELIGFKKIAELDEDRALAMQPKHVIDLTQAYQRLTQIRSGPATTNPQRGQEEENGPGSFNGRRRGGVATSRISNHAQGRTRSNTAPSSRGTGRGPSRTGHSISAHSGTRGSFLELDEDSSDPSSNRRADTAAAAAANDDDDYDDVYGETDSTGGASHTLSGAHARLGGDADQISGSVVGAPTNRHENRKPPRVTLSQDTFEILTHLVNVNITMDMVSEATKQVLAEVAMEIGLPPNDGALADEEAVEIPGIYKQEPEFGCIDKTSGVATLHGPGRCPAVVTCNILENEAGAPLCGNHARQWGDFLTGFGARILRPPVPDVLPFSQEFQKPALKRFPLVGNFMDMERPYCQFCIDAVTIANVHRGNVTTSSQLCMMVPDNLRWECENWAHDFWANPGLPYALGLGCLDASDPAFPIESGPYTCPGPAACNVLVDPSTGGPYCGVRTGDIGTSLFGNVWTGNGHVPELPPLDQHSVNAYVAAALQEEKRDIVLEIRSEAIQRLLQNPALERQLAEAFQRDHAAARNTSLLGIASSTAALNRALHRREVEAESTGTHRSSPSSPPHLRDNRNSGSRESVGSGRPLSRGH